MLMEPTTATLPLADRPATGRVFIRRHSLAVRVLHWVNFITLTIMLMSGLQIFNGRRSRESNGSRWVAPGIFSSPGSWC
jgi:cytochrome b subunit of formate dehydrogenase